VAESLQILQNSWSVCCLNSSLL